MRASNLTFRDDGRYNFQRGARGTPDVPTTTPGTTNTPPQISQEGSSNVPASTPTSTRRGEPHSSVSSKPSLETINVASEVMADNEPTPELGTLVHTVPEQKLELITWILQHFKASIGVLSIETNTLTQWFNRLDIKDLNDFMNLSFQNPAKFVRKLGEGEVIDFHEDLLQLILISQYIYSKYNIDELPWTFTSWLVFKDATYGELSEQFSIEKMLALPTTRHKTSDSTPRFSRYVPPHQRNINDTIEESLKKLQEVSEVANKEKIKHNPNIRTKPLNLKFIKTRSIQSE